MGIDINTLGQEIARLAVIPKNVLRSVVPTYTGFDNTAPTNLANATDGDSSTVTGEGMKTLGGSGEMGTFVFDMRSVKNVIVGGLVTVHSSANVVTVYIDGSEDGITYRSSGSAAVSKTSVAALLQDLQASTCFNARYIRIRATLGGAGDGYLGLSEIAAYELPL